MTPEEIEDLINLKIQNHELRVGWVSGIIGATFLFGNLHAFWLVKTWMNH
jgi:hypothetical protein